MSEFIEIRNFQATDWPRLWPVLHSVFRSGETYSYPPDMDEAQTRAEWIDRPQATLVALDTGGEVLGSYILKPNQPGQGSHVCNCGYLVAPAARGRGIASALCEHSQQTAVTLGFRAMQFNMVVATNTVAVRLWQRHGFKIVGCLPGVFRHPAEGFVDAYVMYKMLV